MLKQVEQLSVREIFPHLAPSILDSLAPSIIAAMQSETGTHDWTEEAFLDWLNNTYNPRMQALEDLYRRKS